MKADDPLKCVFDGFRSVSRSAAPKGFAQAVCERVAAEEAAGRQSSVSHLVGAAVLVAALGAFATTRVASDRQSVPPPALSLFQERSEISPFVRAPR